MMSLDRSWTVFLVSLVSLSVLPDATSSASFPHEGVPESRQTDSFSLQAFYQDGSDESSAKSLNDHGTPRPRLSTLHRYIGYGAVLLGGAAAVSGSSDDLHHAAGMGSATLALGACLTGILEYRGMIDLRDGLSAYDSHAILASLGAASLATAVILANSDGEHSGLASAGAITAGVAIVGVRW